MKSRLLVLLGAAILLTFGAGRAFAHHAASATYVHGKSVTIEGTLKEFAWRNPHSFMKVEVKDDKGETVLWLIEGAAPNVLAEGGMSSNSLRPGDHVIVEGQLRVRPGTLVAPQMTARAGN